MRSRIGICLLLLAVSCGQKDKENAVKSALVAAAGTSCDSVITTGDGHRLLILQPGADGKTIVIPILQAWECDGRQCVLRRASDPFKFCPSPQACDCTKPACQKICKTPRDKEPDWATILQPWPPPTVP